MASIGFCWRKLPTEIRNMVLHLVADSYCARTEPYARAGYASVSREWQQFFEPLNFQRLVIDQDGVLKLEQYTSGRRRDCIEHLFLRIKLEEPTCALCHPKPDDSGTIERNDETFTKAVYGLLNILSTWPDRTGKQKRLVLELGAYSPTDPEHTLWRFHAEQNYPDQDEGDLGENWGTYGQRLGSFNFLSGSTKHAVHYGGHDEFSVVKSKQRLMGTLTCSAAAIGRVLIDLDALRIRVVGGLLIRRQFYWKIPVIVIKQLLTCCSSLAWVRHEGWRDVEREREFWYAADYAKLLSDHGLPITLRELSVFEDIPITGSPDMLGKAGLPSLGRAFGMATRSLDTFSAGFMIDASDFFEGVSAPIPSRHVEAAVPLSNLRKLALTSHLLHQNNEPAKIKNLLVAAGRAAVYMPRLEIMEIWNGGMRNACVFRYEKVGKSRQIAWHGIWGGPDWGVDAVKLDFDIVLAWDHGKGNLTTAAHGLPYPADENKIKTYAVAIHLLRLRRMVLHPISEHQVSWEEMRHRKEFRMCPIGDRRPPSSHRDSPGPSSDDTT